MDWVNTKIKALRKARGLSQEQMAEKLNVQQATYSSWETGKVDLTIGNIERIANALEVELKAIWDPDQFEKKDWKPKNSIAETVDRIRAMVAIIRKEKYTVIGPASRKFLRLVNAEVGQKKIITFHSGRHTFANINKVLTEDITVRRDLLGHDSTKSTLLYDHVNPKQLQEIMQKWNAL